MNLYDEAIEELKCVWNGNELSYPSKTIKVLERAKKVEELLGLYRKHINILCKKDREGVKNSLFSSEVVAYKLYEQIKQKENELEELK